MDNFIGYPLIETLKLIEDNKKNKSKIIKIIKVLGTNNKFNELSNPYVIRGFNDDLYITLFVSYY
jgi:hypothetical protein